MNKLENFYNQLEKNRQPKSDDPYDSRVTHCYLMYKKEPNEFHFFEVRGFRNEENQILISVVNWTLCAGTALLYLKDENVDEYSILTISEYYGLIKDLEYVREANKWYYKRITGESS